MEHSIMNSDGLSALVSQLGCEFDGTFIVTDETPGKCSTNINVRDKRKKSTKLELCVSLRVVMNEMPMQFWDLKL